MSAVSASLPRIRVRALSPRVALAGILALGTAAHALLGRLVPIPSVFPDEYLYSQLGRSLAHGDSLTVRGVPAHFFPVLEPLLTAPMWLAGSVETTFRLVQLENAFAWSLTALPVYWIARRLGAGTSLSLGVAAFAVSGPPALFAAMFLSEPFAYPLALGAIAAALAAFDRPSLRAQLVLLAFVGLATFDRLQLAALAPCIAVALVVVGLRERRLVAAIREQGLLVGLTAFAAVAGIGVAVVKGFGYYQLAPHTAGALPALRFAGVSLYVVVFAAGIAIVPSAVVGLALALAKPRTRAELAFGALTASFLALTVVQCVLWGDVYRVQERYLGYLAPLLALAFVLRLTRRERRLAPELGVAALIAAVAAAVPLNGYATDSSHYLAPTLYAFARLQNELDPSTSALLFAAAATVLAFAGALARRAALPLALVASLTLLVAGASWSGLLAKDGRAKYLPVDKSWVDHAAPEGSTMLVVGKAFPGQSLATLVWNPGIARVVRMPGGRKIDWLDDPEVAVAASGAVRGVDGPVLVTCSSQTCVALRDAKAVATFAGTALWRPRAGAQLGAIVENRLHDGRVLEKGSMQVWGGTQRLSGWIVLRAGAPRELGAATVRVDGKVFAIPAGGERVVRVRACGAGPWRGSFVAAPVRVVAEQWQSPLLGMPRYVADPTACR
jgi:hypothetical protein